MQIVFTPLDWVSLRAGVMIAFAQTKVVDPIGSILGSDGLELEDDMINFNGGPPGTYWGTELDAGITIEPVDGFLFDLETAYLWPGEALQDEHGHAVNSFFLTGRFTYYYDSI